MIKQHVCKFNKIEVILLFERVLNSCTCKIVHLYLNFIRCDMCLCYVTCVDSVCGREEEDD